MTSKQKILCESKPSLMFYLIIGLFPFMIFLADDWMGIFAITEFSLNSVLPATTAVLFFVGLPILAFTQRKHIILYPNSIEVRKPFLKQSKTYSFSDLISWKYTEIQHAGTKRILSLKFSGKTLNLYSNQFSKFNEVKKNLSLLHSEKEKTKTRGHAHKRKISLK